MKTRLVLLAGISLVFSGCGTTEVDDPLVEKGLTFNDPISVGSPEGNSADQYLKVAPDGTVFLSWTEDAGDPGGRNAFIATVNTEELGEPQQMNDQPGTVQTYGGDNRTKFILTPEGGIAAIWASMTPGKAGGKGAGGDMKVTYAVAGGSFQPAANLNDDGMAVNHAFGTIAASPNGKLYATWIDGRNRNFIGMSDPISPAESRQGIKMRDLTIPESTMRMGARPMRMYEHDNSQLMMASSEDGGQTWGENYPVTGMRVCSCCVPNIAFLDGGETVIVSYRFVTDEFLRDQVVVRSTDGGSTFSEPTYISEDGWIATFCPHAAASMTSDSRNRIHAAWFTGGRTNEEAGIYYTYSDDAGQTFAPRRLMARTPAHTVLHAEVRVDKDNRVWVAWENFVGDRPQIFLAYQDQGEGEWSESYQVSAGTHNSILPMLAAGGGDVYVAWTDKKGEASQVTLRSATLMGD
jgi:hypothetical protein